MDTKRKHAEFEGEGPDGVVFRFIAPADSTEEQLKRYAFNEYYERMKSQQQKEPPPEPPPASVAPPLPPLPGEAPQEKKETPEEFEQRLKSLSQAQDIGQGQLIGGAAGTGLSLGRLGGSMAGNVAQNLGRQAELGRLSAQGGTGGEKWARNWAGQERPGIGGVPEASAAYQRSKGQGPVSGRMSKMWGPAGPNEPTALVDRLMARSTPVRPSGLDRVTAIFTSMMGPTTRYALPPLALAGAAGEAVRAKQMMEQDQPDRVGAGLSGISALGGVASLSPTLAPIAAPIGLGAGALQYMRSRLAPNAPVSFTEEEAASRPAFGIYPAMRRRTP
jgi:hypothetical protein